MEISTLSVYINIYYTSLESNESLDYDDSIKKYFIDLRGELSVDVQELL